MGGKAFPNLKTTRLDRYEFDAMSKACIAVLQSRFTENEFRCIESYRNKETFGDLDILWCGPDQDIENICGALGAIRYLNNGPVVSYAVPTDNDNVFQVDLIRVDCRHMESAFSYFAYNDLGNLLGRIFHRAGFKLGHKGMLFVVREEGNQSHVLAEIEVTTSWKEALEFAGYDFEHWSEGFDELEDVFRFAMSIPTANRTIFRLDEMNHQARVRDRKRLTYQKFLLWVNDTINGIPETEDIPKAQLRKEWLERAFETFPGFKERYDATIREMDLTREANRRFNGNLIRELTGLDGKELGAFIIDFEKNVIGGKNNRKQWALSHSENEIIEAISGYNRFS